MDWQGIQADFRELWHAIVLWNLAYSLEHVDEMCNRKGL